MAFQNFLAKLPQRAVHQGANAFAGDKGRASPTSRQKASRMVGEANKAAGKPRPEPVRVGPKVGRNAPCPCGSGKKYKQCCGKT